MVKDIYQNIIQKPGKKIAVLIDPDKTGVQSIDKTILLSEKAKVDFFLIGGSLVSENPGSFIQKLKKNTNIPVILFPGSLLQFSPKADAILFLSLISGRNPELLIGNHVAVAPLLKKILKTHELFQPFSGFYCFLPLKHCQLQ